MKVPYRLLFPASTPNSPNTITEIFIEITTENEEILATSSLMQISGCAINADLHIDEFKGFTIDSVFQIESVYLVSLISTLTNLPLSDFHTITTGGYQSELNILASTSGISLM